MACLDIYYKPESSNGGVFKIYDEPHWPGVFKVYDSQNRQMRGVFKYIYDKPESPNGVMCLGYMMNPIGLPCLRSMNRIRQMRGVFKQI